MTGTDAETPEVTEEAPEEVPEVTEEAPETPEVTEEVSETPEEPEEPETPEEPVGDAVTEQIEEPAEEVKEDAAEDKEEDAAEEVEEEAAEENGEDTAEDQPRDDGEPAQQQAEAAVAYPVQSFRAGAGLMNVTAEVPEGAFPEGTTIKTPWRTSLSRSHMMLPRVTVIIRPMPALRTW